jgi:carboxymethylenebutenolidase
MNDRERSDAMERMKASDFPTGVLSLFDGYVHGFIGRREFLDRAARFAVGGMTAAAMLESLRPDYALAQQVPKDDARIHAEYLPYPSPKGSGTMRGYLVRPVNGGGKLPGIVVIHENRGLNPYIEDVARRLAVENYVAFAPDALTPVGGYPGDDEKAAQLFASLDATKRTEDLLAAVPFLKSRPECNGHVGAIGFCFGGSTVLALAYSGEPLQGVVTFHGSLFAPDETQAKDIKTSIVILTGAEDSFIKPETIDSVRKSFDAANVDWYMVTYAGAHHAFTNPDADNYKLDNIAYNEKAAKRSWTEMEHFFKLQFAKK